MNKINRLRRIATRINEIRCTITRIPAVLLHAPLERGRGGKSELNHNLLKMQISAVPLHKRGRCTITHATGAEINAMKLQMSSMYGKSAVPLHSYHSIIICPECLTANTTEIIHGSDVCTCPNCRCTITHTPRE